MGDVVMTSPKQRPKFGRAEIRDFAAWMESLGWVYDRTDANDHVWYVFPGNGERFSLPQTPTGFSVKRSRRRVLRAMGETIDEGKRNANQVRTKAARARAAKRERDRALARKHAAERRRILDAKDRAAAERRAVVERQTALAQLEAAMVRRRSIERLMAHD